MMIRIERDNLATIVSLSEKAVRGELNTVEQNKLMVLLRSSKKAIEDFDQLEEVKNFGKFKQQKLF